MNKWQGNSQGSNRYTYSNNNPINYSDPSGHFAIIIAIAWVAANAWWLGPAILGAGVVTYSGISAYNSGDKQGVLNAVLFAPVVLSGLPESNFEYETDSSVEIASGLLEANGPEDGTLFFRSMKMNTNGEPELGPSSSTLGIRIPPNLHPDIIPNSEGVVSPDTGGMSVSPNSMANLPNFARPTSINNGGGTNPVWCIAQCQLGPELKYAQESITHGYIEPSYPMSLLQFQNALANTQSSWKLVYPTFGQNQ